MSYTNAIITRDLIISDGNIKINNKDINNIETADNDNTDNNKTLYTKSKVNNLLDECVKNNTDQTLTNKFIMNNSDNEITAKNLTLNNPNILFNNNFYFGVGKIYFKFTNEDESSSITLSYPGTYIIHRFYNGFYYDEDIIINTNIDFPYVIDWSKIYIHYIYVDNNTIDGNTNIKYYNYQNKIHYQQGGVILGVWMNESTHTSSQYKVFLYNENYTFPNNYVKGLLAWSNMDENIYHTNWGIQWRLQFNNIIFHRFD